MNINFNFDMDGTIADLYGVDGWLPKLRAEDPSPYENAKPLLPMAVFARLLHKAQRLGHRIVVISWGSMNASPEYDKAVAEAKRAWLEKHLPSVTFDEIIIVPYGTPKSTLGSGYLFDDNESIRNEWGAGAYEPSEILTALRELGTCREANREILSWLKLKER